MNVFGYIRVSTRSQRESGLGLESQQEAIENYCKMQGWTPTVIYTDAARSGAVPIEKRDGGRRLCEILRPGDVVVVKRLCRAFRSTEDALRVAENWKNGRVRLVVIDMGGMPVDFATPIGKLLFTMLSGFADFERSLAAERTREAAGVLQSRNFAGGGGHPKPGYRFVYKGGKIVAEPDPEVIQEATNILDLKRRGWTVERIFRRYCFIVRNYTVVRRTVGSDGVRKLRIFTKKVYWSKELIRAICNGKLFPQAS